MENVLTKLGRMFFYKAASESPDARPVYASLTPITSYRSWLWRQFQQQDTRIDYAAEVGSMEASSLFMAVANFVGLQMPKANPALCTEVNGKKEYDYDAPVIQLIRRPNPFHIWADYVQAISVALFDDGNCYFKKVHAGDGTVSEFWYLPYGLVETRFPGDHKSPDVPMDEVDETNQFLSHFQYNQPNANPVLFRARDIIHLKRGVDNDFPQKGVGIFRPLVKEVYGDNAAALFTATVMRNMGRVPWILSPKEGDGFIDATQAAAIKEKFIKETTGDNAGTPLVNSIPVDVKQLGFNPTELDLSGMRKMFEARVSAVSNIPAPVLQFLVGQENGTSYASYEQARKQAWESCIIPILTHLQEDFTFQLLPEFKPQKNQYIEFNTDEVPELQADENALWKRASDSLRTGAIKVDEYRAMIGMDLLGPPIGDLYFIPINLQPKTAEELLAPPQPAPAAAQNPPDIAAMAKWLDMDRMLSDLSDQMREFKP